MRHTVVRFGFVVLALLAGQPAAMAAELVIPGSGDCEFVLARLAEVFEKSHPGRKIGLPVSTGSTGGVRAVQQSEAVLARIARPLKPEEAQSGLKTVVFGRDAIVFAVGASVTAKSLTPAQLADLFGGRVTNWREVGGEPAPVRLVIREESDSGIQLLRARLEPFRSLKLAENAKMVAKTLEMVDLLNRYRTAVGWATNSTVLAAGTGVRSLALDGVSPNLVEVASGKYPVATEYSLVFREDRLTREAREFLAFIRSAAAHEVLRNFGISRAAGT